MKKLLTNTFLYLFLFFIFLYKDLFYLVPLYILKIDYTNLTYHQQLLLNLFSSIILVIIIYLIYRKYLKEKLIDYKKNFKDYFEFGFKWWFIGLVMMLSTNVLIAMFSPISTPTNEILVQKMLREAPLITFISSSLIAPFLEEMLFRKSFSDILNNKFYSIFFSGIVFGLMHIVFSVTSFWDFLYVVPYGALGSAFAYILHKTDNIYISITFHLIHNGILTLFSILMTVILSW